MLVAVRGLISTQSEEVYPPLRSTRAVEFEAGRTSSTRAITRNKMHENLTFGVALTPLTVTSYPIFFLCALP